MLCVDDMTHDINKALFIMLETATFFPPTAFFAFLCGLQTTHRGHFEITQTNIMPKTCTGRITTSRLTKRTETRG